MSSKATIFDLNGLEHWYQEAVDPRDTLGLEFDAATIAEAYDGDGMTIYIKMDSQLGKLLYHPEVRAVLRRVSEQLNAEEAARHGRPALLN